MHAIAEIVHSEDLSDEIDRLTAWGRVNYFRQAEGSITAVCCKEIPLVDLTVDLLVIG